MSNNTTWRQELSRAMKEAKDETQIVALAPDDVAIWDQEFYAGYGGSQGAPVLAWSEARVYFPVVYDGAEWFGSAPRAPVSEGQRHEGGQ